MKTILACGGRDFRDLKYVYTFLDWVMFQHGPFDRLVHGDARGADRMAGEWAVSRKLEVIPVPANWSLEGRAAGPLRNQKMLDDYRPDVVVAFPGGRGTADMVSRSRKAGVMVIEAGDQWKTGSSGR